MYVIPILLICSSKNLTTLIFCKIVKTLDIIDFQGLQSYNKRKSKQN